MDEKYIIGIDQSTQGTKALLFNKEGTLIGRCDKPHKQIVNDLGWVEHDAQEIYQNTIQVVKELVIKVGIDKNNILGVGISNQRETALAWDRSGKPVYNAIVWQCARAQEICRTLENAGHAQMIKSQTGLHLSPYFSAAKISWILTHVEDARNKADAGQLCYGTVDTFLIYKLTEGRSYKTDYSNASRTQMFNIKSLSWDEQICSLFHIPTQNLPKVCDSNDKFGETDFEGFLESPIPIHCVMGDSHGALFGQGCTGKGMIKTTYGTGSSVMMNIGEEPVFSKNGLVTSLAWSMNGKVDYVLEGNINYTGAVIAWLEKELQLIQSAEETAELAKAANPEDQTYLVPAFSGLNAPYWDSEARAIIYGMSRTTGRAEIVKAAVECIAYQIYDVIEAMKKDSGIPIEELRVDGGATRNTYLMQFQSDLAGVPVQVPDEEELSGIGVAYGAGCALGLYDLESIQSGVRRKKFTPCMSSHVKNMKFKGWKNAIQKVLTK